jgi:hypothetical protein
MEEEKELTGPESLELITRTINKAKNDYLDTGMSALLWGSVVSFCGLVTFINYYLNWKWPEHIWFLTTLAIAPQVILSIREAKSRRYKTYEEDLMGGIWISFCIAVFLLSYFLSTYHLAKQTSLYLIVFGIPTFATGYARRFRPMILGGLACWSFAILSSYSPFPFTMLYMVAAAQLAWFIPGLILRRCYLKAKRQHV